MNFEKSLSEGYVRKINPDKLRAISLAKSAEESIETGKIIPLKESSYKSILRELYEGLRQYCEAIGFDKGYKFESHKAIVFFLRDILKENKISDKFNRYMELRHAINYYGKDIKKETVIEALNEVPKIIEDLKKHFDYQN
ncbi:MAG: hypothetical protein AABW50_03815 [Nanoarchaeota archaeon]